MCDPIGNTLTAFVNDSKGNLQAKPTEEIVYYLHQHSEIMRDSISDFSASILHHPAGFHTLYSAPSLGSFPEIHPIGL
jgi:hypothetical protein